MVPIFGTKMVPIFGTKMVPGSQNASGLARTRTLEPFWFQKSEPFWYPKFSKCWLPKFSSSEFFGFARRGQRAPNGLSNRGPTGLPLGFELRVRLEGQMETQMEVQMEVQMEALMEAQMRPKRKPRWTPRWRSNYKARRGFYGRLIEAQVAAQIAGEIGARWSIVSLFFGASTGGVELPMHVGRVRVMIWCIAFGPNRLNANRRLLQASMLGVSVFQNSGVSWRMNL